MQAQMLDKWVEEADEMPYDDEITYLEEVGGSTNGDRQEAAMDTDELRSMIYPDEHPMRLKGSRRRPGLMPHDQDDYDFAEYLIIQAMTEEDYWTNVQTAEEWLNRNSGNGRLIKSTNQLSSDQRGWAMSSHSIHYGKQDALWYINREKPSRPMPCATFNPPLRSLEYGEVCDCPAELENYEYWDDRHDGEHLFQCSNCGEVVTE